jgi:hypothetical protein
MNDLIERLKNVQEIELAIRPSSTPDSFRSALERGYVPVRFPNTRGGTELGVKLDPAGTEWSKADFSKSTGQVLLAGELTLDYTRVRFEGAIDVSTMKGTGNLQPVEESRTTATHS